MFSRRKLTPPKSRLTPQKTVSFKVYELEQRTRLKAAYPFLKPEQIRSKIKDQWHNLTQDERSKYTKVTLKSTPVKETKVTSKSVKSVYTQDRKRRTVAENPNSKKHKLDVGSTPEFVNTEKLKDFRTKHTEQYDNDFSDSTTSQDDQAEVPVSDWTKRQQATYQRGGSNIERKTPEIVDNTPCQQPGILKNRQSAVQPVSKGQVSFNSPADVYLLSDVYSDTVSDSDSDGLLLKRSDAAGLQNFETTAVVHFDGGDQDDDDEEDDSGLLITRQEEDCENYEMTNDGIDNQNNETDKNTADQNSFDESMNEQQGNTSETNDHTEGMESDTEKNLYKNESTKIQSEIMESEIETTAKKRKSADENQLIQRKSKRVKKESTSSMEISCEQTEHLQIDSVPSPEDLPEQKRCMEGINGAGDVFKSPLPETDKPPKGRRGRKRTKVDKKSAEMTTPVGSSSKLKVLVTPTISQNMTRGDNYTTPQMDEVLQQLTLEAASKAPQKKRQSGTNANELEKLKALTSGRRVTRSLIAAKEASEKKTKELEHSAEYGGADEHNEPTRYEGGNVCDQMDPSGDARLANRLAKTDRSPKTEAKDVMKTLNNKENQKPNVVKSEQEHSDKTENLTVAAVDKHIDDFRKQTKQDSPHFRIANAGIFYHRSMEQADDSFRSMSEDSSSSSQNIDSSSSPVIPLGQNTNPVLEKALRNLRCTGSLSPQEITDSLDTKASPGLLLSPALSGVSELSSASSTYLLSDQEANVENDTVGKQGQSATNKPQPEQQTTRVTKSQDLLCEMFTDLTPPEQKTKGQYKTQRLVQSGSMDKAKNFTQLMHDEDDCLFF